MEGAIELAVDGDADSDGLIDAGETVTFTFAIANLSHNTYSSAVLRTNVPRAALHLIHDVKGATGPSDDGTSSSIPELILAPGQRLLVSFDAALNSSPTRQAIWTQPELLSADGHSIARGSRTEVDVLPSEAATLLPISTPSVENAD